MKKSGTYTMTASVAAANSTSSFKLSVDGKDATESLPVPAAKSGTDNYSEFNDVTAEMELTEGEHIMRLTVTGAWFDIDYMTFAAKEGETSLSKVRFSASSLETYSVFDLNGNWMGKFQCANASELQKKTSEVVKQNGIYLVKGAGKSAKLRVARKLP